MIAIGSNITLINNNINESYEDYVLVVGGANIEYIYQHFINTKLYGKQSFNEKKIEYGGSGLNYTLRLLSTGIKTFPIIPIGDDEEGDQIVQKLEEAQSKSLKAFFEFRKLSLKIKNSKTIESLILTDNKGRTILSNEEKYIKNEYFNEIIKNRMEYLNKSHGLPKIIMIGHIHSDKKNDEINFQTLSTKKLIDDFYNKCLIYLNLGRSQLEYGFVFWKETLKKVDILQFNLDEVFCFFRNSTENKPSLLEIINQLKKLNINVIITLDRLGALCITKDDNRTIYASEINIDGTYKDKTGAGDAFASGIVFNLMQQTKFKDIGFHELNKALETGRTWATFACTHLGSASNCPNVSEIEKYHHNLFTNIKEKNIDTINDSVIELIDKAYKKCI